MSKVTANYPSYSSSNVSVGGSNASTGVTDGVLNSSYDMSDAEGSIYNYALSTLAEILPQLNTFDSDTMNTINSSVSAYKDAGIADINSLYNSSLYDIQSDVASRFGNLDNSVFKDDVAELESERSKAVSSFAQDVLAKQNGLISDELTQRYALVELLSGLSNGIFDNALGLIQTALGSSSDANSYNSDVYDSLSNMASTSSSYGSDDILTTLLGVNSLKSFLPFSIGL